jgi:HlyD family secretion protein
MKRALFVLLIVAAIGAGGGAYYIRRGGPEVGVTTAPITRGDIVDTVGATGTLQAVNTVQVGSQVSGNISWLGADFNSIVKKNQVIAKVDPSLFQAQVEQARANYLKSQADLEHNKVALTDANQKYTRAKELAAKSLVPQSDLDAAKIAVDSADAQLKSSQATVEQAKATLNQNQVNLDHTIITAPIAGIITQRSVDVGQTVAASLQSPTLFIIADDLTRMQVSANIDEADVGRIRPGQHVTFRVDAYPTENFEGTVAQIRLQPVVVSNVTTYLTLINVPNPQLKLKPGMTANVKVEVSRKNDVLKIPNAAVRFRPSVDVFAALNQPVPPEAQFGGRGGRGGRGGQGGNAGAGTTGGGTTGGGANASGDRGGASGAAAPAASAQAGVSLPGNAAPGGASRGGGEGQGGDRRAQLLERFKGMTADEQQQFLARLKDRGQDTTAFEAVMAKPVKGTAKPATSAQAALLQPKYGAAQSAQTIDALFAPLPPVETRGRVWLFIDKQLKPVNIRLGITDGTFTELLSGELQQNQEVVIGVTGVGSVRPSGAGAGGGNPLLPAQRGGPGRGR